jgi:hypothetical protein
MGVLGRANRTKFRDQVLNPLLDAGLVEMTVPDKLRSSKQKYATQEVRILTKCIQRVKDEIEENHNDMHSIGKDV